MAERGISSIKRSCCRGIETLRLAGVCVLLISAWASAEQDAQSVAKALTAMDAWILAQPKSVEPLPGVSFDLAGCKGIVAEGGDGARDLRPWAAERLA